MERENIEKCAGLIALKKNVSVLTGAGISVESGIPDFRSKGGIWDRYDPAFYAHIDNFIKNPAKIWDFFRETDKTLGNKNPNPAHYALAELEDMGIVKSVATQNIDYLHQKAGSLKVYDLHGNSNFLSCIKCGKKFEKDDGSIEYNNSMPCCTCGYVLKPDIVMFGQMLPDAPFRAAREDASSSSVYMVIGTSAEVSPANSLPALAKSHGADIIEINLRETQLTSSLNTILLKGSCSAVLNELLKEIKKIEG
jgi:NAD-dependent deacetylase